MIKVRVSNINKSDDKTVEVTLPMYEENIFVKRLNEINIPISFEENCKVQEIVSDFDSLHCLHNKVINMDELNYLAKRLDGMDKNERNVFQAVVIAEKTETPREMINLLDNLVNYAVVTDISNHKQIAINIEFAKNGGGIPADFEPDITLAKELLNSNTGKFTEYGIVYKIVDTDFGRYKNNILPEHSFDANYIAKVELYKEGWSSDERKEKSAWLDLPASQYTLDKTRNRLGISEVELAYNLEMELDISDELLELVDFEKENIYDINELFNALNDLVLTDDRENDIVLACTFAEVQSAKEMCMVIGNIDLFKIVDDVYDYESYGKTVFDAEHQRLDFGLKDLLNDYFDFEAYGKDLLYGCEGKFLNHSHITYTGDDSLDELLGRNLTNQMNL